MAIVEPFDRGEHGGGVVEAEAGVRQPCRGRLRHAFIGILRESDHSRTVEPAKIEQGEESGQPHARPLVGEQAAEFVGWHEIAKRGPGGIVNEPVGFISRGVDDRRHGNTIGHAGGGE